MNATILDKKRRMTLPESVCEAVGLKPCDQVEWRVEAGEIRGCKLGAQKQKEAFPRGSLLKYLTPERDKEQLAILSGSRQGCRRSARRNKPSRFSTRDHTAMQPTLPR
ncbi:MAG: AbrB/MazE/SpoVT family DNA-binding domain-containing protein [Verrucomicrobiota bacterium]|jgi:bifunctional DNA-binding transcriptional regulator/antitoxin component of YhaV-PrlF toxin-antitoxin module